MIIKYGSIPNVIEELRKIYRIPPQTKGIYKRTKKSLKI
jgi:hypothetical protein